jgi:quercetin dioxygenase-like cupin family protein
MDREYRQGVEERINLMGVDMESKTHVNVDRIEWTTATSYPEELQKAVHWKILVGNNAPSILLEDVLMGVLDLEAGGFYPLHSHPSPEIYFVLSGKAEWTIEAETFTAGPGEAIYHAPNVPHRMVNKGTEPLRTILFWWAPDGERRVLQAGVDLLEPMPKK